MAYNSDVRTQIQIPESGKFVEITGDSRFPQISVARTHPDNSVETAKFSKYAVLTHIVNASDINISLSSSGLNIGDVGIIDHSSGSNVYANVVQTATVSGIAVGAVKVLTQDFDSIHDGISIGDKSGNYAVVNSSLSALRTFSTNPVSAVSITNPVTAVTITSPVTSIFVSTNSNTLAVSGDVTITQPVSTILMSPALPITFADSVQLDQSGRLRVAIPRNSWWYVPSVDKDVDVRYNETYTVGASSIFVQNLASIFLTSGTQSVSGSIVRGSRRRHKVVPGQSHEWHGVFNLDGKQTNVIKRTGMYTSFNGYFFELSGSNFNVVVRRRLPDGILIEERVEQANWNIDKLDGTGPSKENWNALTQTGLLTGWASSTPIAITGDGNVYNVVYSLSAGTPVSNFRLGTKATISGVSPVDYNGVATIVATDTTTNRLTATYITPVSGTATLTNAKMYQTAYHMVHTFWFDFMGGRTNRVRFGKTSDYGPIVLHEFKFDGLLGTAYENAPVLMERKEVTNFGVVSGIPSFTDMGNTFTIEAETELIPNFCVARNDTGVPLAAEGNEYPILGLAIRTGEPYQRSDIQVQNVHINDIANLDSNNNNSALAWRLVLNPSIQGTIPASSNIGKTARQWNYTTANTISGGQDLLGGYVISKTTEDLSTALNFLNMGSNIDYTDSDKLVLVVKLLNKGTANSNIVTTLNFIEAL